MKMKDLYQKPVEYGTTPTIAPCTFVIGPDGTVAGAVMPKEGLGYSVLQRLVQTAKDMMSD